MQEFNVNLDIEDFFILQEAQEQPISLGDRVAVLS